MNGKIQNFFCAHRKNGTNHCPKQEKGCPAEAKPLSKACGCERFKICKIKGDRNQCARMAQLGVLPGSVIELICPMKSQNCMVKIMGSTVSLDQISAENILVTPA